jgi:threonine/homoserine/homoserine lactone efflux protein
MTLAFLLTSLIIVASPGTGVLFTLATGLTRGARASIVAAFGCTLGILPHLAAAIFGLAAILHTSAIAFHTFQYAGVAYLLYMACIAFHTFQYAGVAYLLYMAWATLRDGELSIEADREQRSAMQVIVHAVLINILNPKLSIFFFAFLPQFVNASDPQPMASMLELSAAFMAMTFLVFALYGVFAASVRHQVIARPRLLLWMRRSFAAAFVALGAKLALTER